MKKGNYFVNKHKNLSQKQFEPALCVDPAGNLVNINHQSVKIPCVTSNYLNQAKQKQSR